MSKKYTYEVVGTNTGFIPGVGAIVDGKIETDEKLEGAQYKLVSGDDSTPAPVVATASQANPNQPQTAGNPTAPVNAGVTQ